MKLSCLVGEPNARGGALKEPPTESALEGRDAAGVNVSGLIPSRSAAMAMVPASTTARKRARSLRLSDVRPRRHTPTSDDRWNEFARQSSPNAMEDRPARLYPDGNLDTDTCPTIPPSRTMPPPTTVCPPSCAAEQSHVSCSPSSRREWACSQGEPNEVEGVSQMMKPFLTTSHGVLYDADCLHVLKRMKSEVIDTVFADPPFNIGKDYKNGYNDKVDRDAYLA